LSAPDHELGAPLADTGETSGHQMDSLTRTFLSRIPRSRPYSGALCRQTSKLAINFFWSLIEL
jgi:hypothetical protein